MKHYKYRLNIKWLFMLAVLLVLIGLYLSFRFIDVVNYLEHNYSASVEIPGQTKLNFEKPGHYRINITPDYGKDTAELHRLRFFLVNNNNQFSVPIGTKYITPRRFIINDIGTYTLYAEYDTGVGPSATANVEIDIFKYPQLGFLCAFLGVVLYLATYGIMQYKKPDGNNDDQINKDSRG